MSLTENSIAMCYIIIICLYAFFQHTFYQLIYAVEKLIAFKE